MILVTGGGTGGHFYPGLAAAKALVEAGQTVAYIGAKGGIEERLLPESGLSYHLLPAGKLSREALRPSEGFKVMQGLAKARSLLASLKPKAIISMGGYAGFPAAFVGALMGTPLLIHEQNAKLGLANRMLAPLAKQVMLSTPLALKKSRVVGFPVREEHHPQDQARAALGLENRPTLLVLGGSQGSQELNTHLPDRLSGLLDSWQVVHQCGTRWESAMQPYIKPHYHIRGYLNTPLAWSAADFAITRGGAGTLAEAAFHGVPILGVPLPKSLDSGAQLANVGVYAEAGAARLLESWEKFSIELNTLQDPSTRAAMRDRLTKLSPRGATKRLVETVLEVIA
jgi:UDP-N-acetylglucosamine--N-acetylmuramyl-(pentapeptide) pyrophosphoryl-undecaprenol N-acetylglucosamine transferase